MTTLKRGMVIDVDLNPTKGSETGKVRPGVIVTKDLVLKISHLFEVTTDQLMKDELELD